MVISTTSDIDSHANDTQKRYRERSNTWIRLQLFLRVSQNKQTNKQKQKNEREKKKAGRTLNKSVLSCCGAVTL